MASASIAIASRFLKKFSSRLRARFQSIKKTMREATFSGIRKSYASATKQAVPI